VGLGSGVQQCPRFWAPVACQWGEWMSLVLDSRAATEYIAEPGGYRQIDRG
jgi:hypothetical protein